MGGLQGDVRRLGCSRIPSTTSDVPLNFGPFRALKVWMAKYIQQDKVPSTFVWVGATLATPPGIAITSVGV